MSWAELLDQLRYFACLLCGACTIAGIVVAIKIAIRL